MPDLYAYTDGACSGNPGPGGWGAILMARDGDTVLKERELNGGAALTTNNQMELMAAISEDLWKRLDAAQARHNVTWEWVKGHAGHPENERADELARAGMAPFKP